MKLHVKGDRRYREATQSEVIEAAASVLIALKIDSQATYLMGMANLLAAQENNDLAKVERRLKAQEEKPL